MNPFKIKISINFPQYSKNMIINKLLSTSYFKLKFRIFKTIVQDLTNNNIKV